MPEVKALLRICGRNFYGWHCQHDSLAEVIATIDAWRDWSSYPIGWPRKPGDPPPLGVMPLNADIRANAKGRLTRIRHDLEHAGPHYPRDEVQAALACWRIEV